MGQRQKDATNANTDLPVLQRGKQVEKPWGYELWFAHNDKYVGKLIFVKQGSRLSLQYHEKKDETLLVIRGLAKFTIGDTDVIVAAGDGSVRVRPNCHHRIEAITDVTIVEVSTPEITDVVRIEDDFGRVGRVV